MDVNWFYKCPIFAKRISMLNIAVKVVAKQRRQKKHLMYLQGLRKVRAVVLTKIVSNTYFIF